MIDIHTHILPRLDDGSSSVDESLKMLEIMSGQGVDTVVATPHFYIDHMDPEDFLARREESFQKFKEGFKDIEKRPQIALGAEVQFYPEIASLNDIERFCLGETRYILIEMPFSPWTGYTYHVLNHLSMSKRIVPVIAHIERYTEFMDEKETIIKLKEAGALIQISSSFIIERTTKRKALKLLKSGAINFVASDCHNTTTRLPDAGDGVEVLRKKLGSDVVEDLEYWEEKIKRDMIVF